jgi:hypothetical protein
LFNPIRASLGQSALLPASGSTFLEYSAPFGPGFAPDLTRAYLEQNNQSLGLRRSLPSQKIDHTVRPLIVPDGWTAQLSSVSVRAEVERSLEQTGINEFTRSLRVGRGNTTALVRVSAPAGAQNAPFSLGITFDAEGSSFPVQLGVRVLNGLVVSDEANPVRVNNGDPVGVPAGSTVWFEVSLGDAVTGYLAPRVFRRFGDSSTSFLDIPLKNVSLLLEERPQGLSWSVWNCAVRGSLREVLQSANRQVVRLDPRGVTCFAEVGLAEGWQPGGVRGQIVSSELTAPISFWVQKGQ